MSKTYLALDLEFLWDDALFDAHKSFDSRSDRRAAVIKRIIAAAIYEIAFDDEGRVSTGPLMVWSEHAWGDEESIVRQVFDFIRAREGAVVLTYGGLGTDIPILQLAAMEYGIPVPPQLLDVPGRWGPRPHLDLGLMLKGGGKSWFHLSQVGLRIGIPVKLLSAKADVPRPCQPEAWRRLEDHVALDTLVLALAWTAWLVTQGTNGVRYEQTAIALISAFMRRRPEHAMGGELRGYSAALVAQLASGYEGEA